MTPLCSCEESTLAQEVFLLYGHLDNGGPWLSGGCKPVTFRLPVQQTSHPAL